MTMASVQMVPRCCPGQKVNRWHWMSQYQTPMPTPTSMTRRPQQGRQLTRRQATRRPNTDSSHIFMPVAIESVGTWNHQAVELVQELGRRRQPSLKTPGRQLISSSGCQWLYSGVMQSPCTALSPPTKRRCGLLA